VVVTAPARWPARFLNSEFTVKFLERIVPPIVDTKFGWIVSSLLETPTASDPAFTPKELSDPRGVLLDRTDISSALTVEALIELLTVGLESTEDTEPPAAIDTSPKAADKVPT
jgi:hypothetical protein